MPHGLKVGPDLPFCSSVTSILASAIATIDTASRAASTAAANVARDASGAARKPNDPGIVGDFVTLGVEKNAVAVGCKLAEVAQQTDRALLDILA